MQPSPAAVKKARPFLQKLLNFLQLAGLTMQESPHAMGTQLSHFVESFRSISPNEFPLSFTPYIIIGIYRDGRIGYKMVYPIEIEKVTDKPQELELAIRAFVAQRFFFNEVTTTTKENPAVIALRCFAALSLYNKMSYEAKDTATRMRVMVQSFLEFSSRQLQDFNPIKP